MQKAFSNFLWKNYPSTDSPLNEQNLMKINSGLDIVDDRVITLDTTKFDKTEAQGLIKKLDFNRVNGVFTITYYNGSKATIDTLLEKLAVNFNFDESAQQLIITLDDGTIKRVDLSAFIKPLELIDSGTIDFQLLADGKVTAIVKEGSIEEKHLRPNYLADIKVESGKAAASAAQSASSAKESESWAHGNTGIRPGEGTDNSKYWSEQSHNYADSWKGSLLPKGTIPFSQIPTSGNVAGHMYNISNAFASDARFKDGAGYSYPAGTNIYWTTDGKWDCLSGVLTMELTQAEYDALPDAEKLNGTIYYISDGDNTLTFATDKEMGLVIVDSALSGTSHNPVQNKIVTSALNQKAPLASPVLTGTPTAPTPATSTNSTQIATTAFVKAVVNALIDGAPETLDTLKEIADALAENETVVRALNAAIGTKVDKVAGKGLSTNDYTTSEKNKLAGIASGAEVNVQADWNTTDANSDAFIKNKPTIPAVGNGTVTIKQAGTQKGTFTMNQSGSITIELTDNNTTYGDATTSVHGLMSPEDKTKLNGIASGAQVNSITGVKGSAESSYRTGNVNLTPANVGLGNVNNTADANKNVSSAEFVRGNYTGSGGQQSPSYVQSGKTRFNMWNAFKGITNPAGGYMDVILMDNYTGSDVPYVTGIGVTKNNGNPRMFIANGAKGGTGNWAHQVEVITTGNIGSQVVASATKATQDGDGNVIKNTYLKYQILTQAQYNALTDAQKKNGLLYFVSDAK